MLLPLGSCFAVQRHYEAEYGFPSTHAMISLVLPWYAIIVADSLGYPLHWPVAVAAALVWTASITLSRLYVGVHSMCDLVGGLLLGGLVLLFGHLVGPAVDGFVVSSSLAPLVSLVVCLTAILSYPSPAEWTNAYGDTALIIAVVAGITCASSSFFVSHQSVPLSLAGDSLYEQVQSLCAGVVFKLLRMVVGSGEFPNLRSQHAACTTTTRMRTRGACCCFFFLSFSLLMFPLLLLLLLWRCVRACACVCSSCPPCSRSFHDSQPDEASCAADLAAVCAAQVLRLLLEPRLAHALAVAVGGGGGGGTAGQRHACIGEWRCDRRCE